MYITEACRGLLLLKNMLFLVQKETLIVVEQFLMHVFMLPPNLYCFFIRKNDQSQSKSITSDLHKLYETVSDADICERMQQLCI